MRESGQSVRSRRGIRAAAGAAAGAAVVVVAVVAVVATGGEAVSQDGAGARAHRPPPLPALAAPAATYDDIATGSPSDISDLRRVALHVTKSDLIVDATLGRDFVDGVFTRLVLRFDSDGSPVTDEVAVHSAVGSRFRPSAYVPRPGESPPLELLRSMYSSRFDETKPGNPPLPDQRLIWRQRLAKPAVGANQLRASVPLELIFRYGAKSATTPPSFTLELQTTCSEHPCSFDYDAQDEGVPVTVDGSMAEWSGGPWVEDAPEELHPTMSALDICEVWCDHDADHLVLAVVFEEAGFGRVRAIDGDVTVGDELVVEIEPRGTAYMKPFRGSVPATVARGVSGDIRFAAAGRVLELSVPRHPQQSKFRIAVWTDALRADPLDAGRIAVPARPAGKPR